MKPSYLFLLSLCSLVFWVAPACGAEDDDWQLWSSGKLQVQLNQRWQITLEQQLRFEQNMSDLFYRYSDLGIVWKTASWLETSLHFAPLCQKSGGDWKKEQRPFVDGSVKHTWSALQFADRHRLEMRFREDAPDLWRYRNKLTMTGTSGWTRFRMQPYAWGEVFVHLQETDFYRWRLSGGFKGQAYEKLSIDISYLRQGTEKDQRWIRCHVLNVKLMFAL